MYTREKPLVTDIYPVLVCHAVWSSEEGGVNGGDEAR